MSETILSEHTSPVDVDLAGSMTEALANQVQLWSNECQRFLAWQRQYVLLAESASELHSRHEAALRRLLALGRMLNAATSDPAFLDPRTTELVKARLAQLQESWALTHTDMTATEAEAFLTANFQK